MNDNQMTFEATKLTGTGIQFVPTGGDAIRLSKCLDDIKEALETWNCLLCGTDGGTVSILVHRSTSPVLNRINV